MERGLINETQLTQILSHQLAVPWVSLLHIEFSRQLLNLVPREVADRFCLVPIYVRHVRNQGDTLYVAMDDPSNEDGLRACREHAGLPVRAMIAPPTDIRSAIRVYYGVAPPAPPRPRPPSGPGAGAEAQARRLAGGATEAPAPAPAAAAGPSTEAEAAPAPPAEPERAAEPSRRKASMPRPLTRPPRRSGRRAAPPLRPGGRSAPEPPGGPLIEAVEIDLGARRAAARGSSRLRIRPPPPPSSPPAENIPRPRGRTPRMVALTLLDGTTITLPAKRRRARRPSRRSRRRPKTSRRRRRGRRRRGRAVAASSELPPSELPPSTTRSRG